MLFAGRDVAAERRAKEKAETPTVKTEEQTKAEDAVKEKAAAKEKATANESPKGAWNRAKHATDFRSIWTRKFRDLPEEKAVDLFADIAGDAFIIFVGVSVILWEAFKNKKPDANMVKISELEQELQAGKRKIEDLEEAEKKHQERLGILEQTLHAFETEKEKKKGFKAMLTG